MSKQIAVWKSNGQPSQLDPTYCHPMQSQNAFDGDEANQTMVVSAPGTFRNLRVVVSAAPGSGKSWEVTLRVNGADTALMVTISNSDTDEENTADEVTVAAGDLIALEFRPPFLNPPALMSPSVSLEFDSDVAGTSIYGGSQPQDMTTTRTTALLGGTNGGGGWSDEASIVAVAGTFTRLDVSLNASSGTGTYTFNILKNGVVQDGSGGTVDTTLVITAPATSGSSTFSLSCDPLDEFQLRAVPSGLTTNRRPRYGVALVADIVGNSNFHASPPDATDGGSTTNYHGFGDSWTQWSTTEADHQATVGVAFELRFLAVSVTEAPGAGKGYGFTLRKNGAATSLSAGVIGTNSSGSDTGFVSFAPGDLINVETVPIGSPTGLGFRFACCQFIDDGAGSEGSPGSAGSPGEETGFETGFASVGG
jgi:hypothetical protein